MTLTVKIDKNAYGGDGLGRLADGRVIFVTGAFANEVVRAEITEQKKYYVKARLAEVLEPSKARLAEMPDTIPGMVYAPISYEEEIRLKQDQLTNFLRKVDRRTVSLDVLAAPNPYNYRNKVTYHVAFQNNTWKIGYQGENSHVVQDITHDPLALLPIDEELPRMRASVRTLLTQGVKQIRRNVAAVGNVTMRYTPMDGVKWWFGDPPRDLSLMERTCGLSFRVSADGFWQVNPAVGECLVKKVRDAYLADVSKAPHILDLYCGVGVFGLVLKHAIKDNRVRLTGIESGRTAIADAKANAEALHLSGNFFSERVGASLNRIKVGRETTVVIDPPRGGMEKGVPAWLASRPAPRLFYVSCDPATLVRDLSILMKSYEIRQVHLLDMFPRTARFETFVELDHRLTTKSN